MSLLEELKEKQARIRDEHKRTRDKQDAVHREMDEQFLLLNDLARAIAALSPSEALLDPQPETASPEFASEQGEAEEEVDDLWRAQNTARYESDTFFREGCVARGEGKTQADNPYTDEDPPEAEAWTDGWKAEDKFLGPLPDRAIYDALGEQLEKSAAPSAEAEEGLGHTLIGMGYGDDEEQGEAIEEMIATSDAVCEELSEAYTPLQIPEGFDVPEEDRDEKWVPPPGYTYIPVQNAPCTCVDLMQDSIGNYFCCNQRNAERTSVVTDQDRVEPTEPSPQPEPLVPLAEAVLQTLPGGVEESRDQSDERIEDVSQAETATEQTLITDDIPSIPREEIPIGAAVETYTDSGLETVKISGTTYVVDDEPERQAETQPEAAYAPVNEDEARMWSNGFEADARAKTNAYNQGGYDPEAVAQNAKRPFWVFGKAKVDA